MESGGEYYELEILKRTLKKFKMFSTCFYAMFLYALFNKKMVFLIHSIHKRNIVRLTRTAALNSLSIIFNSFDILLCYLPLFHAVNSPALYQFQFSQAMSLIESRCGEKSLPDRKGRVRREFFLSNLTHIFKCGEWNRKKRLILYCWSVRILKIIENRDN